MKRWFVLSPLALFLLWAVRHLAEAGPKPFFERWIDVSMGLTLALVASLLLAKSLLKKDEEGDGGDGDAGGDADRRP